MRIKLALAAAMLLIAVAAGRTLAHAPMMVIAKNSPSITHNELVSTTQPTGACQSHEVLPAGTTAIRLGLTTALGPRVLVEVFSGARVIARGVRGPGWEGASVTVPVNALARTVAPVKICLRMSLLNGIVTMLGPHTRKAVAAVGGGRPLPGRMHVEYLRPGDRSWWSLATSTARRLGLGRAASGTWNALLVMTLGAVVIGLSSWLLTRELR